MRILQLQQPQITPEDQQPRTIEALPEIKTERLVLREPTALDTPYIVKYASDKDIHDATLKIPHPYSELDAEAFLRKVSEGIKKDTEYIFAIEIIGLEKFTGTVGFKMDLANKKAEVGYWIGKPFWGRGYVTEALKAALDYGFNELGLNRIEAHYLAFNEASGAVMLKAGMHPEGVLRQHVKKGTEFIDVVLYGLTVDDYRSPIT